MVYPLGVELGYDVHQGQAVSRMHRVHLLPVFWVSLDWARNAPERKLERARCLIPVRPPRCRGMQCSLISSTRAQPDEPGFPGFVSRQMAWAACHLSCPRHALQSNLRSPPLDADSRALNLVKDRMLPLAGEPCQKPSACFNRAESFGFRVAAPWSPASRTKARSDTGQADSRQD